MEVEHALATELKLYHLNVQISCLRNKSNKQMKHTQKSRITAHPTLLQGFPSGPLLLRLCVL